MTHLKTTNSLTISIYINIILNIFQLDVEIELWMHGNREKVTFCETKELNLIRFVHLHGEHRGDIRRQAEVGISRRLDS